MSDYNDIVYRLRNPTYWFFQIVGPKSGATVQGESDAPRDAADEIERLRAELATSNARIMELERIEEVYRNRKPIVYSVNAQAMSDRVKAAEAERDALRAQLAEAREALEEAVSYMEFSEAREKAARRARAALKGDDRD